MPSGATYRPDIDGLRAVAILSVLGYHAFPELLGGGFTGVDIFFVISGFLISCIISQSIDGGVFSCADFYVRRIKRIFPSLVLVLFVCLSIGWLRIFPYEFKQIGKHIAAGVGFVSNLTLWSESGYFDAGAIEKPLLHLWSLAIEEQFYIAWPLSLYWLHRARWNPRIAIMVVGLLSFGINIKEYHVHPAGAFYSPISRFWELLIGCGLALSTLSGASWPSRISLFLSQRGLLHWRRSVRPLPPESVAHGLSLLGAGLILAALLLMTKSSPFPGYWALCPTFGAFLLIAAGPNACVNKYFLATNVMVWVGVISYPLYLWHWPLLSFQHLLSEEPPSAGARLAALLVSFPLSYLTYRFLERPIRFGGSVRPKVAALCVAMGLLGACGLWVFVQAGVPKRYPQIISDLSGYQFNYKDAYREGTYFLRPEQGWQDFAQDDVPASEVKRKRILLWGDSYAAHLYPGLVTSLSGDAQIIQRTSSSCPPVLGVDVSSRPYCRAINDHVLSLLKNKKMDTVILSAAWQGVDKTALQRTLREIQEAGVSDIVLVGPTPTYDVSPARMLLHYMAANSDAQELSLVPEVFHVSQEGTTAAMDFEYQEIAAISKVQYVSAFRALCSEGGCLTRVGDSVDSLVAWDGGHLTSAGSQYMARYVMDVLLRDVRQE